MSTAPILETPFAVRVAAEAELPTRHGFFRIVSFDGFPDGKDHVAFVRGDVSGAEGVPVRVHSECLTGDAIGSLRCDCRDQLEGSLQHLGAAERGVLLYLRQEGRGIGLSAKVRAYALQDGGLDTVDANLALGRADDEREYGVAAAMLAALGVASVHVMTNNPEKLRQLVDWGMPVAGRIPLVAKPRPENRRYLVTKAARCGHLLGIDTK
jgi:GTP cyclohydrolase II